MKKVKLVAIAKDEARYLPEWIFHHSYFGFDSFDIYVNNTSDNSWDVLCELSEHYDINIIDANELYQSGPNNFQSLCYEISLKNTQQEEFSHIAFLDVDEFWTPADFEKSIHEFLSQDESFDVYLFNWAIHKNEQEFGSCFSATNRFAIDYHVKHIVRLGVDCRPGIHNAHGPLLSYADSDLKSPDFIDKTKAKVVCDKNTIPSAFVVHRLYRSQMEYVSMLGRGRPRGDRFKSNRFGYYTDQGENVTFQLSRDKLEPYQDAYGEFLNKTNIKDELTLAESFVCQRYQSILNVIDGGVNYSEAKVLQRALNNITLPSIDKYIEILKEKISSAKIFQIGFNKSGTASIYHYLKSEGFNSIHWDDGHLSKKIKRNYEQGIPLLTGYESYQVFTDMEHREENGEAFYSAEKYYKELDAQYPGSIFILNYRDLDKWLMSRRNHPGYLQKTMNGLGFNEAQVIQLWTQEYHQHIKAVKEYFQGKDNLIVIDLDIDRNDKLSSELKRFDITLSQKNLPHTHKTKATSSLKNKHIDAIRDASIFFEKTNLEVAYQLMRVAHELRPEGQFIKSRLEEIELKLSHD